MADPVHPPDRERVAGHRRHGENRELDGDRGGLGGVRGDEGDDLRGGDRVAVVGVVEQEPAARRPREQDQEPAAAQERSQPDRGLGRRPGAGLRRGGCPGLVAGRLGHLAAQPDGGGRGDRAQAEQKPPGEGRADAATEQGERDQRADDEPDRLGGEDQPDHPPAVPAVGVLAHQHGADRVVAADAEAEQEPERDQHRERRGQRRADRRDHHQRGRHPVHPGPADDVGEPAEHQRAEESRPKHDRVEQCELFRAEMPLGFQEGGHDADHEQVVGIGEEAHPRHQQRAPAESRQRRRVRRCGQRWGPALRHWHSRHLA